MSYIADLHVHSYLSRATSRECNLEGLHRWAQLKGVRVVGTGDFTHPAWYAELCEKLEPAGPGLFRLRPDLAAPIDATVPPSCRAPVDFLITGEISSIYKRDSRCRKVHSLLCIPDLDTAGRINAHLDTLGNIKSDGRPILGLDPRDLLELMLDKNPRACLIPAHVWTPWFSMLGSNSGFDSPAECFGDLLPHVFAAETGLSSDPPMNWRVRCMDSLTLVSNSDCHSPSNLARNANLFHGEPDFFAIRDGLSRKLPAVCGGTIDMFPEEGKYHADGHRKCDVCLEPEESLAHECLCPVCGKPLVLGVLHRVVELADRPKGERPPGALPHEYIIPLPEVLAEILETGVTSKKVDQAYHRLLAKFGPELRILRELDPESLGAEGPALLPEAIRRLRAGQVIRQPGYDGEYGVIRVFGEGDRERLLQQGVFLQAPQPSADPATAPAGRKGRRRKVEVRETQTPAPSLGACLGEVASSQPSSPGSCAEPAPPSGGAARHAVRETPGDGGYAATPADQGESSLFSSSQTCADLTDEQRAAAMVIDAPVVVVAGPGTGKTRTLTHRVARLIQTGMAAPSEILAVTFTNRAAGEMRERLERLLGADSRAVAVATFHSLCLRILRDHAGRAGLPDGFGLADDDEAAMLLRRDAGLSAKDAAATVAAVSAAWRRGEDPGSVPGHAELTSALARQQLVLLDDLVPRCVKLWREHPNVLAGLGFRWVCVDEYQDINRPQYDLIRLLAGDGRGLFVIGDPDQAIYGFRGADRAYFLQFEQDFPTAKVFGLSGNFRSTGTIVAAAGRVIAPGRAAMSVAAESMLDAGVRIRLHEAASAAAEAEFIAHEVEKWLGGTALFSMDSGRVAESATTGAIGFSDIAVLVRLRSLMSPITEALTRLGLPVQTVADTPFIEQPGARQVLRALRQATDYTSGTALDVLKKLASDATVQAALGTEGREAWEECWRLASIFPGTLRDFLDTLALRRSVDAYDARAERLTLLTLHAAKGLEFPVVFIVACEDGVVPYARPGETPDIEEERRLLYVGMTRAQQVLYLTSARRRALFGRTAPRRLSPFVTEIEAALREVSETRQGKRRPLSTQLEFNLGE